MTGQEAQTRAERTNEVRTTRRRRVFGVGGALALMLGLAAPAVVGVAPAFALPFHGITLTKSCNNTTPVGQPLECAYQITNADDNSESITVSSLTDVVHAAGGNASSGNILASLTWTPAGGASCSGPTCTLPTKGASVTSALHSFYTVQAADFTIDPVGHLLDDTVSVSWSEPVCVNGGCPVGPKTATTGASTTVTKATPSITTKLSATAIDIGGTVTDQATLVGATANAGGTVSYAVYSDVTCETLVKSLGTRTVTNGSVGPSDVWTADTEGNFWFQATYSGDGGNVGPIKSGCETEPITVGSPPSTEGTTATTASPQTTVSQQELPRTGGPQGFTALIALSFLLVGAALWLFGSRIRSAARR